MQRSNHRERRTPEDCEYFRTEEEEEEQEKKKTIFLFSFSVCLYIYTGEKCLLAVQTGVTVGKVATL